MSIKISFMHYTKLARVTLTVVLVLNFKKFELVCIFSVFFLFCLYFFVIWGRCSPQIQVGNTKGS